jgi:ribosomal protein S18 acetylase RimI-like enzyme
MMTVMLRMYGKKRIVLVTRKTNVPARALFEKFGFVVTRIGDVDVWMERCEGCPDRTCVCRARGTLGRYAED